MKNTIKMSLAAAVAVSALSTSAFAGSLEDAVKDTSISGQVTVGYTNDSAENTNETTSSQWEYDVDVTLTTKVNDTVSATIGAQADQDNETRDGSTGNNTINLTKAFLTMKAGPATVMVGKQGIGAPFMGDERADGVVALVPAGPITLAAAHFTNATDNDLGSGADIEAVAVLGSFGPANVAAWYVDSSNASAYSVNAKVAAGPANVEVAHASAELDSDGAEAETLTKVVASIAAGPVTVVAGYAMTNDSYANNVRAHGVDLSNDGDESATNFTMDQFALDTYSDTTAYLLAASADVAGMTLGAAYGMVSLPNSVDAYEVDVTAAYAMSKNFTVSAVYSTMDVDGYTETSDNFNINASYKF